MVLNYFWNIFLCKMTQWQSKYGHFFTLFFARFFSIFLLKNVAGSIEFYLVYSMSFQQTKLLRGLERYNEWIKGHWHSVLYKVNQTAWRVIYCGFSSPIFVLWVYFLRIEIIINNPFTGHYSKHTATQPLINSSDKHFFKLLQKDCGQTFCPGALPWLPSDPE